MPNVVMPVNFQSPPDETIKMYAYAFTRGGQFLQRQDVTGNKASFKDFGLPNEEIRYFFVPAGDPVLERIRTIPDLLKFQPFEPVINWKNNKPEYLPIPDRFPILWKWILCRVTGRVVKRFNLFGLNDDKPLCRARVHICEVDRLKFIIDKIPDHILVRIPDIILKPEIPIRIPRPIPDPIGPVIRPTISGINSPSGPNIFKPLAASSITATSLKAQTELNPLIINALSTNNTNLIRSTLLNNYQLFHPYFCYHPWIWPWLYKCDEIKTVYTDMNGRFDTNITYLAGTDIPDLYFWVEYLINGTWTTVYKPNVPCNTFWDYKCGTEVTIRVTDERVGWGCPEILGGEIVWVKTIGHGASVSHIRQDNFSQGVTNDAAATFNRIGLTNALVSSSAPLSSQYIRPFGGNLYFLLQFSSGLPKTGIYYYKWKYCKTHRPDLSVLVASPTDTDFTDMDNTVNKSYTFEYKDFFNITRFDSKSVKLGPNTVGTQDNLYQIPPINPAMAPFNASETSPQWDQNTASINFDSNSLDGDGLYEFRLELFDKAGNKVTNLPRTIFQVPHPTSFTPSVNAPNNMLVPPLGATASAYTMKVRIDNQPCEAAIYKIKKGGVETTSDCCGFVKYVNNAAPLEVSFKAYHPHNLGEFSFGITKGTCSDPAMSNVTKAVGVTLGNANAYARDVNGKYSKNFFPSVLLGICNAGGKAAFAETLSVFTLAIDGNNRLSYLDRHDVAAFALEP